MSGRIPEGFIQQLLSRVDIVEVIGTRLELKRSGRELKARSPFTNEKTPSFFVNPAKQMYFDFSSGKSGNAIGFLMEHDRLGFIEAVEELARQAGMDVPREAGGSSGPVLDGPLDALALAERHFRSELRRHPAAIDYLKRRGVSGETARTFGIGFAPESWDALSRQFPDPTHALTAGLLIERDGGRGDCYDRFRNRIMFPIRDTRGRVIAFGGRTLGDDPAKYLNSPETPLFSKGRNLFGLYEAKQAVKAALPFLLVVEGYMDVVMLAQHGITQAVATLGTATTREHLMLLFKSAPRVVFCFDGDRAGRAAGWRALEQVVPVLGEGREVRFMFLPDGHDPDTLVQQIGAEAFLTQVGQALPLSEFLLAELSRRGDLGSRDGRARFVASTREYLSRIQDPALRQLLIDDIAKLARMTREDADALLAERAAPAAGRGEVADDVHRDQAEAGAMAPPLAKPVRRALQLLLESPALAAGVSHLEQLASAPVVGMEALIDALEFLADNPSFSGAQLAERWRGGPYAAWLAELAAPGLVGSEATMAKEFSDSIELLRGRAARARAQSLLEKARLQPLIPAETAELRQVIAGTASVDGAHRPPTGRKDR